MEKDSSKNSIRMKEWGKLQTVYTDVLVKHSEEGWWSIYRGTQAVLVREGLAVEAMFPEKPKRVRTDWDRWRVKSVKGGAFELTVWHKEPIKVPNPTPWNPAQFKAGLAHQVDVYFHTLITDAYGEIEASTYGAATHRVSSEVVMELERLRNKAIQVLWAARVVPASDRPKLRLVYTK